MEVVVEGINYSDKMENLHEVQQLQEKIRNQEVKMQAQGMTKTMIYNMAIRVVEFSKGVS